MNTSGKHPAVNILAFAGSLRKGSYNKALIHTAKKLAPESMSIDIFDLSGIPLYNADVESVSDPETVSQFKEAIKGADALLIATPEYNHSVAGVTKNAIDWASRPPKDSSLNGKPVGIMGASPSITGTARGQSHLRQAFTYTNSYPMQQPQVLIYNAPEKFDDEGTLTDEESKKFLKQFLDAFYDWILLFK